MAEIVKKEDKLIKNFIAENQINEKTEAALAKQEKKGVDTGLQAIHPITKKLIPIWIANFVLMEYGTGAVMCVPGHDQRDYDFAKKYSLPILQVIETDADQNINDEAIEEKGLLINSDQYNGLNFDEAFIQIAKDLKNKNNAEVQTNFRLRSLQNFQSQNES